MNLRTQRLPVFVAGLVATAAIASTTGPGAPAAPRPSLLLVTLDTTRADHLGCYGGEPSTSPNIDRVAAAGTRFANAVSPVPLTLPAHVSLMTGLGPSRHGVHDNSLYRLDGAYPTLAERLRDAGYHTAAFVSSAVLDRVTGIDHGFELFDDRLRAASGSETSGEVSYEERTATRVAELALDYLKTAAPPFFLWVHFYDPHLPYAPPEPYRGRFPLSPYDGEIAYADEQLGRLLAAVQRGASGSCLVVIAGDHGESLGEHGERSHGLFVYQATQHVPLIVAGPGVPAGAVVRRRVGLVDVAPTVLELLGLAGPDGRGLAGRSLVSEMAMTAAGVSAYVVESVYPATSFGWAPLQGLVRGPWKYIAAPRPELYDLERDPGERRNLIERRTSVAERLKRELSERNPAPPATASLRPVDPELEEQRERVASLGYLGGSTPPAAASERDPKDGVGVAAALDEAWESLQRGEVAGAIPLAERVLGSEPRNMRALEILGSALARAGDLDRAVEVARRALVVNPGYPQAVLRLALFLRSRAESPGRDPKARAGDVAEAERGFARGLALRPRDVVGLLAYARLQMQQHRPERAREILLAGLAAKVEDAEVEMMLGLLEATRGEMNAAAAALDRALTLNPRSGPMHEAAGRVAAARGDLGAAAEHFARALALAPRARVAVELARLRLDRLHDPAGALEAYERSLAIEPEGPQAAEIRKAISELRRRVPAP